MPCHCPRIRETGQAVYECKLSEMWRGCGQRNRSRVSSDCHVSSLFWTRSYAIMASLLSRPTFVFLKGSLKVDQVRGADARCVLSRFLVYFFLFLCPSSLRALESTLKTHSTGGGGTGAFSGKGQTLGGSSAPQANPATTVATGLTNLDPQVKVFLGLIGAYLILWYFSS